MFYLPPVSWFAQAKTARGEIVLEACENYQKQSLRNRCYIDSPNGTLALTVPIDRSCFDAKGKCLMSEMRIAPSAWQRQHWQALETSYYNSPFFEYLADDFRPFYTQSWLSLADMNEALIAKCLELLDIDTPLVRSTEYLGAEQNAPFNAPLNTKRATVPNEQKAYYQTFRTKHGFLADLSIVDLIFNEGPEAPLYL